MLTCINVKFICDSVCLGLSSSANILQIADVALQVVFLLFFGMLLTIISPTVVPAVVLTLETSETSAIFFHNQNNSTSSPGLLG